MNVLRQVHLDVVALQARASTLEDCNRGLVTTLVRKAVLSSEEASGFLVGPSIVEAREAQVLNANDRLNSLMQMVVPDLSTVLPSDGAVNFSEFLASSPAAIPVASSSAVPVSGKRSSKVATPSEAHLSPPASPRLPVGAHDASSGEDDVFDGASQATIN